MLAYIRREHKVVSNIRNSVVVLGKTYLIVKQLGTVSKMRSVFILNKQPEQYGEDEYKNTEET